jgi:beta-lactamase superfamily II metal-dependent hydrolase
VSVALLLSLIVAWASAWAGTVRVDVLDIGQGDSILIRTPAGKAILIDAGDGQIAVPPMLAELGVTSLDLVIATHPHADHIGGMDEVLDAVPVKMYTDNGLPHTTKTYEEVMKRIEEKKIPYRAAQVEQTYKLDDGAKIEILFPTGTPLHDTRSDLNSNSVVARLTHGDDCFLFVGDSEEPTEDALLQRGLTQCDVLKVAHHGSRHSSTQPFLEAVKPKIALISVGTGNRYGHPGEETLSRLEAIGAKIYRTDTMGQLTALSSGHGVIVETGTPRPGGAIATRSERTPGRDPAVTGSLRKVPTGERDPSTELDQTDAPQVLDQVHPKEDLTPAAADEVPASACPFQASRSSEVFHAAGCGNAARISPTNLVCYATREAAIAAGKRSAGCCHP